MSADDGTVTVIGEALVDILRTEDGSRETPGGSSANVAVALGRLGREAVLATVLADDANGATVRRWLEESGVRVVAEPPSTGRTSTALVDLAEDGSAAYEFDLAWNLTAERIAEAADGDPAALHAGSIATVLAPGADAVETAMRAARGRSLVTFDPNARPAITPELGPALRRVERLIALSDVVKVSDEDLAWYHPGADPVEVARSWAGRGPLLVVVTLGAEGSVLVRGEAVIDVPGVPVAVADTIGAGDTFMGALIDALMGFGARGKEARGVLAALSLEQLRLAGAEAARA
ncbi:carbohydrate kinase family protein, partial [Glycomyces tenuis]